MLLQVCPLLKIFSLLLIFDFFPANSSDLARVKVNYISFEGWQSSISNVRKFGDLPKNAQNYIKAIEKLVEVPGIQTLFSLISFFLSQNESFF